MPPPHAKPKSIPRVLFLKDRIVCKGFFVFLYKVISVSYTHLDVYKRQDMYEAAVSLKTARQCKACENENDAIGLLRDFVQMCIRDRDWNDDLCAKFERKEKDT